MTEQAEDGFLIGEENDQLGLEWIAKFGFLRAADIGSLLWGRDEKNHIKYGQRICRKWVSKGYVIKRELPSKAGAAFVLAAAGVKFLEEKGIKSKTGKDWGRMKDGEWLPPTEWKHHLIANGFLCLMEDRGLEIVTENELRAKGNKGKVPDGIFITDKAAFFVEVENQRKSGNKMEQMTESILSFMAKDSIYKGKKIIPIVVYAEESKDERGYTISHKSRVINSLKAKIKIDYILKFVKLKLKGFSIESFNETTEIIESDRISGELKRLTKIGTQETDEKAIYHIGDSQLIIDKKTFVVQYKGQTVKYRTMTEARRTAARANLDENERQEQLRQQGRPGIR